ncbi:MAG: rRNA maturation RNase YbeY [Candidatus Pacebacteria bacterium]|nr:rRNA maturation RNase YbeY [Candidatus Paceibacterota bacterium]
MILIKNFTKNKLNQKYLNKIAEKTLKITKFKKPAEISLVITGEKRIRSLNKKYRKINKITDVLSFGFADGLHNSAETMEPTNKIIYLGEIFICYSQAVKQAKQKKHSLKKEMSILLIHGILHLLGYDHQGNYEDSEMKILEEGVLDAL